MTIHLCQQILYCHITTFIRGHFAVIWYNLLPVVWFIPIVLLYTDGVLVNKTRLTNAGLMLGHRLRRCPNIKPALIKRVLLTVVFTTNNVASADE